MRILVTGATGFVGRHLLRELRAACPDARLFGLGRRTPDEPLPGDAIFLAADLCRPEEARAAVGETAPTMVYHLAGEASAAGGDRDALFRANVEATENLWEALAERGASAAMLVASSGYVYGPCDEERPATEEDLPAPRGEYAESKARMEARLRAEVDGPVRVVIARAFNHAGPGQSDRFAVPAFARQIVELAAGVASPDAGGTQGSSMVAESRQAGPPIMGGTLEADAPVPPIIGGLGGPLDQATATASRPWGGMPVLKVGNLEARRDFTDVRDVARAYRRMLEVGEAGECFNVCSGTAVSLGEVLQRLQAIASVDFVIERDPTRERASDVPVSVGSPRKLEARTGWRREFDLTATLADVLAEWRARCG